LLIRFQHFKVLFTQSTLESACLAEHPKVLSAIMHGAQREKHSRVRSV